MATDTVPITEHGVATLPEQAWERARRRAEIIGPLAQSETVGHEAADAAAQALGLSRRQVYVLIRRARQAEAGLAAARRAGRVGGRRPKMTAAKLDAARKLLAANTAPRDVAASVGVSLATLYRHLPAADRGDS